MEIIDILRDINANTPGDFHIEFELSHGENNWHVEAPNGAILLIADDFGGEEETDENWGFTYTTYANQTALELRVDDHTSGGTTETEARNILAAWFEDNAN